MSKVSVIISTYNGANKIGSLLRSLLVQTDRDFEVIIVIDGSTDNTIEVLKPFERLFNEFKVFAQENKGRAGVKNRGAQEATGDILIFYDDDMYPYEDSVARHKFFHLHNRGILSGNPIEPETPDKTDIQNYKAYLTQKWTEKYPDGVLEVQLTNLFFAAANCSMRRETFEKLNGFDNKLMDAEDYDFAYRALRNGVKVFFDKKNGAIHYDPVTCHSYIKRLRAYTEAHKNLKDRYPERYNGNFSKSPLEQFLYRIFASPKWCRWIDEQPLLIRILPKPIRYKVYDRVIQALVLVYPNVEV